MQPTPLTLVHRQTLNNKSFIYRITSMNVIKLFMSSRLINCVLWAITHCC